jgi:putative methyltransferase (TIGR04325 family)
MSAKQVIAAVGRALPLAVRQRLFDWGPYGYCGRYDDWLAAVRASEGYQAPVVLQKTRDATAKVRAGAVPYQQDGVTFDRVPDHAYRLALVLAVAALERSCPLRVVDFGGALGGAFFSLRPLLPGSTEIDWTVVEQPAYCEAGRREFGGDHLSFCDDLQALAAEQRPDVLLCSSVLQFLEDPLVVLRRLIGLRPRHLVIDRTPFSASGRAEITVQRVPASIYRTSFPSWLLCEGTFAACWQDSGYRPWLQWDYSSSFTARATFKGFALKCPEA